MDEIKFDSPMHVHCYKHNGSLHRVWDKINFYDEIDGNVILANTRAMVTESDGRRWFAKEPAITIFMKDRWFNVICMLRNNGVHFYCNISSPFLKEDNIITYIDYDLDLVKTIKGELKILDEDEYAVNKEKYGYGEEIERILRSELECLKEYAKNGELVFNDQIINDGFNKFWNAFMGKNYDNN